MQMYRCPLGTKAGAQLKGPHHVALVALLVEVVESIKANGMAFGKTSKRLKDLKCHDLAKICSQNTSARVKI